MARMTATSVKARNKAHEKAVVGLARVPEGVKFRCGECSWFARDEPGLCDNPHPDIHDKKVDAVRECCNLYDHPGMRVIVA